MKIVFVLILMFVLNDSFSQDKNRVIQILTYIHGCRGNCNFSYDDSCGLARDSIMNIIRIVMINDRYYQNDKIMPQQKVDSLNAFLVNKSDSILQMIKDVSDERKAIFVPPAPKCFEFEEYKINYKSKIISFMILQHESNINGVFLYDKIAIFDKLERIIK